MIFVSILTLQVRKKRRILASVSETTFGWLTNKFHPGQARPSSVSPLQTAFWHRRSGTGVRIHRDRMPDGLVGDAQDQGTVEEDRQL
jgi:hypothetical protein